jgi:azurin
MALFICDADIAPCSVTKNTSPNLRLNTKDTELKQNFKDSKLTTIHTKSKKL